MEIQEKDKPPNTTIRHTLEAKLRAAAQSRLAKLEEAGAPDVMVARLSSELSDSEFSFADKVGRIKEFGHLEFSLVENKKYRRGWGAEFTLEGGIKLWLIPGPYSLFLTAEEK